MIVTKPINISDEYRKLAMQGEPIFDHEQNLVVISVQDYEEMKKAKNNVEYLTMLKQSDEELKAGKIVYKTMEELESMEN
ncbi:MAG: type II toxin-antitoxin system Phd/YefM family antitoxin [Lachnospiraceae bacterium]|nr:type II toxin-antitoxin system Phd/YefM family antitoxin [Lachnospiraceae bacterium]